MSIYYDKWNGLYRKSWKGHIVDDAMGHPAKFARGLIEKIYDHAREEGWVDGAVKLPRAGDIIYKSPSMIIDCFAGVALGALDAMRAGMNWVGVEIEDRFCDLGNRNIDLWNEKFGDLPHWGTATLIRGDSRNLANIHGVSLGDIAVSSPPFLAQTGGTNVTCTHGPLSDDAFLQRQAAGNRARQSFGDSDDNLGNMAGTPEGLARAMDADLCVTSPPYGDIAQSGGTKGLKKWGRGLTGGEVYFSEYGNESGQLSKAKMTPDGFDIAVASPPYSEARIGENSGDEQIGHQQAYGGAEGQLGKIKATPNGYDVAVSSPPFEGVTSDRPSASIVAGGLRMGASSMGDGYGDTSGNIGNNMGEDFWLASRKIIEQVFAVLKPGGHAIWVCKRYVKGGKYVYFPRQWAKICVAVGFEVVHWHRAMVVEERGAQYDMYGNLIEKTVERKSFFRRLAETKGAPRIDWEDVICMRKRE